MEQFNIILNGKAIKAEKGQSVLDVAKSHGITIPTLCHDPRLSPYSSCYVCVVEIEGIRGLQPSCSTMITEGMKINTDNEKIHAARKTALDLLVSNHYADCQAPCIQTCPAGVDVQGYISLIEKGMYREAVGLIKEVNPLPAICGRVCVRPCEVACRRNLLDEGAPVGIDYLKRFAADRDLSSDSKYMPEIAPATGKKVAIIGAGPGGISTAYFLQKNGHQCDIYEAAPAAGGWLRYGIPEYRLPNDIIDKEVDAVKEMGAEFHYHKKLGDNLSYKELKNNYDATVLTIGSQVGTLVGCEGDDADGVFSGITFLKNMEMTGQRYDFSGKTVVVVGGGNTAMDCCRTAVRCNAKKVYIVYRRTEKEMPANPIEIHESKLEGVEYLLLTNPAKINKDSQGKVKSMTLIKMELGEPDASGRRRPIPVEGSEFNLDVDYILAAIGQKTDVNFINDINEYADGELKINRWGDIEADPKTLQTGIPGVFAAGDGVTGPATLIEAIAQAKIASRTAHQYLTGQDIEPETYEFISKRDNFKEQVPEDYIDKYKHQSREEMPVLDPEKRKNFSEVELGYKDESVAKHEANRCLECGCVAYYDCDLKKHATAYHAEQTKYMGEFKEYDVDFSHPYIEIDNNKCILCARCVRICQDVVGANALGMVNRGFITYVAPAMGKSLLDTTCESCGMCISACPTAAITENVPFKPGPLKMAETITIDNYGSEGGTIALHHHNGFFMKATGKVSDINKAGNISRFAKFGYRYMNDKSRITKPMIKKSGKFVETDWNTAKDIIVNKLKSVEADKNGFFAGARLLNEEIYLIQKLARAALKTNNIHSFLYLSRGSGYIYDSNTNVPFEQIKESKRIYLIGADLNRHHTLTNNLVFNAKTVHEVPVELITTNPESSVKHKVSRVHQIKSYFYFVRALNHYLLSNNMHNQMYLNDHTVGFDEYKTALLQEDYNTLLEKGGGCDRACLENIAEQYNREHNAIMIFSEHEVSGNTTRELQYLSLITGKAGKRAAGIIALKEKNNTQGLFDMGGRPNLGVGAVCLRQEEHITQHEKAWNVTGLNRNSSDMKELLEQGALNNVMIFGEDPVGCTTQKETVRNWLSKADFVMVCDYFMTETAAEADLILPATLPLETNGTFTNTQKVLQQFEQQVTRKPEKSIVDFLIEIQHAFGLNSINTPEEVLPEAFSLLPGKKYIHKFRVHNDDDDFRMFEHGCDILVKRISEEMISNLNNKR